MPFYLGVILAFRYSRAIQGGSDLCHIDTGKVVSKNSANHGCFFLVDCELMIADFVSIGGRGRKKCSALKVVQ